MSRRKKIDPALVEQRVAEGIRDLEEASDRAERRRRASMTAADKAAEEARYERLAAEQKERET